MKIKELKEYVFAPARTILEVSRLQGIFQNVGGAFPTNKRKMMQGEARAARIDKYATQRWGKNWQDRWMETEKKFKKKP